MSNAAITTILDRALAARAALFDERHQAALRLLNGFSEGCPELALDLYAATLVIHNYADPPALGEPLVAEARAWALERLPWLRAIVLKERGGTTPDARQGRLIHGAAADRKVREHGVWYAVDITMNRDASLYLDTRNLRGWALRALAGKQVLNTFAYTGSLGVAATAAGAARVLQLDLNKRFLNLAKDSYTLNGFPISRADFLAGDFWPQISQLKRAGARFDCVFLDPPFFASTAKGVVDLEHGYTRLINKVRPLIADGGWLVAINNALFVSGAEYIAELDRLCADGYLAIEELIAVPDDFVGYPGTRVGAPAIDPAPFNHPTKIALLRVRRKTP
jgi:23S rRNA (cytosine1962-C5)-methyltransferase